jgi:hypothetical protein
MEVDPDPDNTVFGGAYSVGNVRRVFEVVKEATSNHMASEARQESHGPRFYTSLRRALIGAVPRCADIEAFDCHTWDPDRIPADNRTSHIKFPFKRDKPTCFKCSSGLFRHPDHPNYPGATAPSSHMMEDEPNRREFLICPPVSRSTPPEWTTIIEAVTTECKTCAFETICASDVHAH